MRAGFDGAAPTRGAPRGEEKQMKIGKALIAAAAATLSLPALSQTTNSNNRALADCLQAADQKYKDTWKALCEKSGSFGQCIEFVGTPRDIEFSQLRLDEMAMCAKLYAAGPR
jgi:hypothetical protein